MKKKSSGSVKRGLLTLLCVVLALILTVAVAATIYVERLAGKINFIENEETYSPEQLEQLLHEDETTGTGPVVDPGDVDLGTAPTEVIGKSENIINLLLIGQDRREGQGRQRSDSMILLTINKEKKIITMTSFMRDMYVKIPGHGKNKINASYVYGGMQKLDETLMENFGVHVDGNVEVDFSGFMKIVDIMGGVDIELKQEEADYLNRRGNWEVEENQHWSLTEGVNHLNGSQALAYCRIRYVGNADYERTQRQRTVLTKLFEKVKQMDLATMDTLLNTVVELISTDMSLQQITGYAMDMFPLLTGFDVVTQRIPADGTYSSQNIKGAGSVLVPNLEKNIQLLKESIGE